MKGTVPSSWKLTSLAPKIWQIYNEEYKKPLKLRGWPMQYFITAMTMLILDYLPEYGIEDDDEISDMIRHSIDASGLVPSMVLQRAI